MNKKIIAVSEFINSKSILSIVYSITFMKRIVQTLTLVTSMLLQGNYLSAQHELTFLEAVQDSNLISLKWDSIGFDSGITNYKVFLNNDLYATVSNFNGIINNQTVFRPVDNMIKVEAESFAPAGWEFKKEWNGYSGKGYMQAQNSYNNGQEGAAIDAEIIPDQNEWFIVNFRVEKADFYRFDCRFAYNHSEANDLWIRYTEDDNSFHKIGRVYIKDDIRDFKFFSWNMGERYLEPGVHRLFIAPRSSGLCLDYIVIYSSENPLITQKDEIAEILYGYWLVRAMNPEDLPRIETADIAVPESHGLNLYNLEYNKEYNVEIRAVDTAGNEIGSISETIIMEDTIPPSLVSNIEIFAGLDFLNLSWEHAYDNHLIESYTIFLNDELYEDGITDTTFTIEGLDPNTEFDIALEAADPSGNTSERINIKASTLQETHSAEFKEYKGVKIFPNPVAEKVNIESSFRIKKVELYTVTGTRIVSYAEMTEYKLSIDIKTIPAGIYLLKLTSETGEVYSKKILKQHK